MSNSKKLIIGNWKMNKTPSEAQLMLKEFIPLVKNTSHDVMIAPSYACLSSVASCLAGSCIGLVSQDVSCHTHGAYTGEVSVSMLKDIGVKSVILGHSERRQYHGETDETVNKKLLLLLESGLKGVLCVGESLKEREAGQAFSVVQSQLEKSLKNVSADLSSKIIVAYEPLWAIGTGKTASSHQAEEMHCHIRKTLSQLFGQNLAKSIILQYGGSVKPDNVSELMGMPNIDGALVGGASLDPQTFASLINFSLSG